MTSQSLRLGLVIPNTWDDARQSVTTLGPVAESLGFDSVWVTDHVIGHESFEPLYGPTWLEALSCLAYLAGVTSRVRIGMSLLVVPYRDPVYAAKALTTLDLLSDGRLDVGAGVGWADAEFQAVGQRAFHEHRGAVTDEALEVVLRCWKGGSVDFDGEFFQFSAIEFAPTPKQAPHPPLWIGGAGAPNTLRRAARFGDVWHPATASPETLARLGDELDELAGRRVRRGPRINMDPADLDGAVDVLAAYADAGADEVIVEFRRPFGPGGCEQTVAGAERLVELLAASGRPAVNRTG